MVKGNDGGKNHLQKHLVESIRDCFWIWGHPVGAHDNVCGINKHSRMTTMEGAAYLGVRNSLVVNFCGMMKPPLDQEMMALDSLDQVICSIVGAANAMGDDNKGFLEEVCRLAQRFPNIKGGIFDDFFCDEHREERKRSYTPDIMERIREKLHNNPGAPLDMWAVLYEHQLNYDIKMEIDQFDGITFWTWFGRNLRDFDQNLKKIHEITTNKRRLLGCYLYNYGESCEFKERDMEFQLNRYVEVVRSGEAEGIILLSNVITDLGFEAVEYTKKWLKEHGDEPI